MKAKRKNPDPPIDWSSVDWSKRKKNSLGNPILTREEYLALTEPKVQDAWTTVDDLDTNELYSQVMDIFKIGREKPTDPIPLDEYESFAGADRQDVGAFFHNPTAKGGAYLMGKPNDVPDMQNMSTVRRMANAERFPYWMFKEDDPKEVEGKKDAMIPQEPPKMPSPTPFGIEIGGASSKNSSKKAKRKRTKRVENKVKEFRYDKNKPAKESLGNKARKRFKRNRKY